MVSLDIFMLYDQPEFYLTVLHGQKSFNANPQECCYKKHAVKLLIDYFYWLQTCNIISTLQMSVDCA